VNDGRYKSTCGHNGEPKFNITTIIVPFLHVNSGNIYCMSCGSECVTHYSRSVFTILVSSATCIPVRKNSCQLINYSACRHVNPGGGDCCVGCSRVESRELN
jgi:hypothetical protein